MFLIKFTQASVIAAAIFLLPACSGGGTASPILPTTMNASVGTLDSVTASRGRQPSPKPSSIPSPLPSATPIPGSSASPLEAWQSFTPLTPWQDSSTHGTWYDQFGSYGTVEVTAAASGGDVLSLSPEVSTSASQTESALVTSVPTFANMDETVVATTVAQLRQGSPPNSWEVAWVLWHYTDNTHFYSLNLKPNGWELGKEDPAYPGAQRFLATGSTPVFPTGVPYTVRVVQVQGQMVVYVNGISLTSFTDTQTPYLSGSVGLYCEDSHVTFGNVMIHTATSVTESS
jgi:hypothetical protein